MLDKVKLALAISVDTFNSEIEELIQAAVEDLQIAEVDNTDVVRTEPTNPLVSRAIITYCAYHFELEHGSGDKSARYKASYDEQKAQLSMASEYTIW